MNAFDASDEMGNERVLPLSSGARVTRRRALQIVGGLAALPLPATLGQTRAPAAPINSADDGSWEPDLANQHSLMEWLAHDNRPRLSYLDGEWRSLDAWKDAARPVFRQLLHYSPAARPAGAELLDRDERADFTVERLKIRATEAYDIPARLLIPKRRSGRLPAVLAMHCHSGRYCWGHEKVLSKPDDSATLLAFRERSYGGRAWAEVLARRGYVVIVIDAFYFGERRLRAEELQPDRVLNEVREAFAAARKAEPWSEAWLTATNRVCGFYEHLTARTLFSAGVTWPGLHVWDDMRTVDYLLTRPEVDPNRIGCAGLSIGGLRTAHLIGADPRIKAAVIAGFMSEWAYQLRNRLRNHTWMIYVPGLRRSLDLPDVAALHSPGALLVQQCGQDRLFPLAAMRSSVEKLTRIYAKAGIPERFRGTFYDEPHSFKVPAQEEAFDWFDRWL